MLGREQRTKQKQCPKGSEIFSDKIGTAKQQGSKAEAKSQNKDLQTDQGTGTGGRARS